MKKTLLISCVGDESRHKEWIGGKNYDLFLIYFGKTPNKYKKDAKFYYEKSGYKFNLIYSILAPMLKDGILKKYDYISVFDDDLSISSSELDRLLDIVYENDFVLAQGSLTQNSSCVWKELIHNPAKPDIRKFNAVEIMCPIMRKDFFLYQFIFWKYLYFGIGLDAVIWDQLLKDLGFQDKVAVINSVQIWHTRKVGSGGIYKAGGTRKWNDEVKVVNPLKEKNKIYKINETK